MSANSLPPSDLPVSFYLIKQCKLWVWDFDDTLINTETYLRRDMKPSSIRKLTNCDLDSDFAQWRYFKRLIEFLVMHGKYVAIASFGTYEIIRAYMDRIFGFNQRFFGKQNIIAPCLSERNSRNFNVPPNKNEYIYQLMKIYRVQDFERVALFDDMPSNISSAIGIGIIGVQIATPKNGDVGSKMYFGPWIMTELDKKLVDSCCNDINNDKAKLTVDDDMKSIYSNYGKIKPKLAFGTSIGDRKISKKPEYRWNKMNVQNPPLWQNGTWQTNGGIMTMETLPDDSTLGGFSYSFWDNKHRAKKTDKESIDDNEINYDSRYIGGGGGGGTNHNIIESFENSNSDDNNKYKYKYKNCESCKKISWNWITFCLMVIIFMMILLGYNAM